MSILLERKIYCNTDPRMKTKQHPLRRNTCKQIEQMMLKKLIKKLKITGDCDDGISTQWKS